MATDLGPVRATRREKKEEKKVNDEQKLDYG